MAVSVTVRYGASRLTGPASEEAPRRLLSGACVKWRSVWDEQEVCPDTCTARQPSSLVPRPLPPRPPHLCARATAGGHFSLRAALPRRARARAVGRPRGRRPRALWGAPRARARALCLWRDRLWRGGGASRAALWRRAARGVWRRRTRIWGGAVCVRGGLWLRRAGAGERLWDGGVWLGARSRARGGALCGHVGRRRARARLWRRARARIRRCTRACIRRRDSLWCSARIWRRRRALVWGQRRLCGRRLPPVTRVYRW